MLHAWDGLRAWDGWTTAWATGVALSETMVAAGEVIAARSAMIGAALADPAKGDWAELSRMAPEKVAAFGLAAQAAALDVARMQADALKLWGGLAASAAAGRPFTAAQAGTMLADIARSHSAAAGAPGRMLAPVRRSAMSNARRLKR